MNLGDIRMKKKLVVPVLLTILCLVSGFSSLVKAGVEPSPFITEEKQLHSISNSLTAYILPSGELAGWHVDPPTHPGYLKGESNQLNAMTEKMGVLDEAR